MDIVDWLRDRLAEASTWRGLVALMTAAGVTITPEQADAIIAAGLSVIGVIGVFLRDRLDR